MKNEFMSIYLNNIFLFGVANMLSLICVGRILKVGLSILGKTYKVGLIHLISLVSFFVNISAPFEFRCVAL